MTKHLLLATTALALVMGPFPQGATSPGSPRTAPERTVNFHFSTGMAMAQETGGAAGAVECDPATQDCPTPPPAAAEEAPAEPAQEGAAGNAGPTAEELERRAAEEAAAAAQQAAEEAEQRAEEEAAAAAERAAEDAAIAERRAAEEAAANEQRAAEDAAIAERKAAEEAAAAERRAAEEAAAAERAAEEDANRENAEEAGQEEAPQEEDAAEVPVPQTAPENTQETTAETPTDTPTETPAESTAETPAEDGSQDETTAEQPVEEPATEETAEEPATDEPAVEEDTAGTDEQPAQETGTETQEAATPETPEEAPEPKALTEATVEEQIEKADEQPVAVVPEGITEDQIRQLRRAEERRREDARERRNELIGAAAVGLAVGVLLPSLGGRVVEDQGDRFVVERDGRYYVRRDESALFRYNAENVVIEPLRNGRTREIVTRPNGSQIITVRDAGGYILRRVKVTPNGDRYVLFDARDDEPLYRSGFEDDLPPLRITMPQDEYIVVGSNYDRRSLADVFAAPPVQELPERYTLREVRESEQLRSFVRRVDLDTINFASGSAYVTPPQVDDLANIAGGMLDVIERNPGALFLIEGHTDAVGSDISNLTLSDRRAETVARILAEAYDVPPENMVVEGYGEQFLKVETQGDERANRRVTVRNISPLLETAQN